MKDNSGFQMNEDDSAYSPKRRRIEHANSKSLRILLIALLILIFAGGILYFLSKRSPDGGTNPLQLQVAALEQKVAGLEKQFSELQGKLNIPGKDSTPALLQRLEALTQKVEGLEKQKASTAGPKGKPSATLKKGAPTDKQYHTVQKGETLYQISKKYKMSVEGLRRMNNLSPDKPLRVGQKLLVSTPSSH